MFHFFLGATLGATLLYLTLPYFTFWNLIASEPSERSLGHERRASGSERAEPGAANLEREPSRASGRLARATERRAPSERPEGRRASRAERREPGTREIGAERPLARELARFARAAARGSRGTSLIHTQVGSRA